MVLCDTCTIRSICHEPMKYYAEEMCQYYHGKMPDGYIYFRVAVRRFHEQHWRRNVGYIRNQDKSRAWLRPWDVEWAERDWKRCGNRVDDE